MVAKPKNLDELDPTIPAMTPPRDFTALEFLIEAFRDEGIFLSIEEATLILPRQAGFCRGIHGNKAGEIPRRRGDSPDDKETRKIRFKKVAIAPLPAPELTITSANLRHVSVTAPTERQILVEPTKCRTVAQTTRNGREAIQPPRTPPPIPCVERSQNPLCQALLILLTVFLLFFVQG